MLAGRLAHGLSSARVLNEKILESISDGMLAIDGDGRVRTANRQAVRLLESWPDAEDVSASAFLELFRRRDDVRIVNGSVLPWLLVTTANLARNATRARRRWPGAKDWPM